MYVKMQHCKNVDKSIRSCWCMDVSIGRMSCYTMWSDGRELALLELLLDYPRYVMPTGHFM